MPKMIINLRFCGKDSVWFDRDIEVPQEIYEEFKKLTAGKKSDEKIFLVDAHDVKNFLDEVCPGISPKVLRTAKCNQVLVNNLKELTPKDCSKLSDNEKIRIIYKANLEIAKTLNHQKNVAKNQKEQETKASDRVDASKARLEETKKKQIEKLQKIEAEEVKAKEVYGKMPTLLKEKLAKIAEKREKLQAQLERQNASIEKAEFNLQKRKETADIALGTSLANYADPKIVASWSNYVDLPIEKIYSKSMAAKFDYAIGTDKDYWLDYES